MIYRFGNGVKVDLAEAYYWALLHRKSIADDIARLGALKTRTSEQERDYAGSLALQGRALLQRRVGKSRQMPLYQGFAVCQWVCIQNLSPQILAESSGVRQRETTRGPRSGTSYFPCAHTAEW